MNRSALLATLNTKGAALFGAVSVAVFLTFLLTDQYRFLTDSETSGDGTVLWTTIARVVLAVFAIVLGYLAPRRDLLLTTPVVISAAAFGAFALISTAWSDDAGVTLRKLVVLACLVVAAFGFAQWFTLTTLNHVIVVVFSALLVLGYFYEAGSGALGFGADYRFIGTAGASQNAAWGAVLVLFGTAGVIFGDTTKYEDRSQQALWWVLVVFGLVTVSITTTTHIIIALGAALIVSVFVPALLRRRHEPRTLGLVGAALVVALVFGVLSWLNPSTTSSISTWDRYGSDVSDRAIAGYGYLAYPTSSHNMYVDLLLDVGAIGTILFLVPLALTAVLLWNRVIRVGDPDVAFGLGLVVFALVAGFGDADFKQPTIMLFVLLLVVFRVGSLAAGASYGSNGKSASAAYAPSASGSSGLGKNVTASAPASTID